MFISILHFKTFLTWEVPSSFPKESDTFLQGLATQPCLSTCCMDLKSYPSGFLPRPADARESVPLTSCKHRSYLLNFFLAFSQKPEYHSSPTDNGPRVGSSQPEDQNHKAGIWREGDGFSFYSWSVQLPCLGGSTHTSQSTLERRAGHRTPRVCLHVKASTVRASLKGCSSATSCAHKHLRAGSCW